MQLRVIRAESMPAALRAVRAELGPEALILSSRKIAGGIEVAAASAPPETDPLPPPLAPLRAPPAAPPAAHAAAPAPSPASWAAHGVPAALAARLAAQGIAQALAFAAPACDAAAPPLLLVGPPGAGKTLTAAKLATRLAVAGEAPMVITADGRRAGAVDQLAAFTQLLGLDLLVAPHPASLAKALATRDGQAAIIDGAGLDPFDPGHAAELQALAEAAQATMMLVLPANLDAEEAAALAAAFARLGATHLLPTRLDQARRLGAVVAAASQGLAIAGFGTGPGAADGLAEPDPTFLAGRLSALPAFPGVRP